MIKSGSMEAKVKSLIDELFSLVGIKVDTKVEVKEKEGERQVDVEISSKEESGLLIGSHGTTLEAIQYFLGLALKNETGEWVRVNVDIADWKEKQNEHLVALARHTADLAVRKGEAQYLYNLTPSQRRAIHLELSENKEVSTRSEGEGLERFLVVEPKDK